MTVERGALRQDGKEDLNRFLIEEFYKDSVERYGADSEQARVLSKFLAPASTGREQ